MEPHISQAFTSRQRFLFAVHADVLGTPAIKESAGSFGSGTEIYLRDQLGIAAVWKTTALLDTGRTHLCRLLFCDSKRLMKVERNPSTIRPLAPHRVAAQARTNNCSRLTGFHRTTLMSPFVRTFEPIPKYRRYLRLIVPLSTLWCNGARPILSKRSTDE
jgi:hypothetical protein